MPPRSSRPEPLSRARILDAALAIVDEEGLAALSMRRVGEALGVEAMSLYNHVANKAALLDGVVERVLRELPPPRRSATWQLALRERASAFRAVLRAHRHALPLFATRPAVTPASIAELEVVLEILRAAGFRPSAALTAMQCLLAFVIGHTLATTESGPAEERSVVAYEALAAAFPRVREAARLLPSRDVDKEFLSGLSALIDGLERQRAR